MKPQKPASKRGKMHRDQPSNTAHPHAAGVTAYLGETPLATEPASNDRGDAGFRVIRAEPTAHFL